VLVDFFLSYIILSYFVALVTQSSLEYLGPIGFITRVEQMTIDDLFT
jgi:hypothetical protein